MNWLAALGLQQHYAAFYQAGYGNTHSLAGLTDNHLNVIEQGCPGGLPAEHRRVILSAAQQLNVSQSFQATAQGAATAPNAKSLPVLNGISSLPRSETHPEADLQAAPLEASLQSTTAGSIAVDRSMSPFASIASSNSNADSAVQQRPASTMQSSIAAPAKRAPQQEQSRPAAQGKAAPSQSQLQELYSQMEADYKKLQDRPAHPRAYSHPPLHGGAPIPTSSSPLSSQHQISGISALCAADRHVNRHDSVSVPASVPKAGGSKDHSTLSIPQGIHIPAAAGISVNAAGLQQARPSLSRNRAQQQSQSAANRAAAGEADCRFSGVESNIHGHDMKPDGAVSRLKADQVKISAAVSAAAAIKQMRKDKRARPEEPFVQVFTNFHMLSKVRSDEWTSCSESLLVLLKYASTAKAIKLRSQHICHAIAFMKHLMLACFHLRFAFVGCGDAL